MAGVVFIISIPTEEHEKNLKRKIKKKRVKIQKDIDIISSTKQKSSLNDSFVKLQKDLKPLVSSTEYFSHDDCEKQGEDSEQQHSMEKMIGSILENLDICNAAWTKTEDKNFHQIIFSTNCGERCEEILEILRENDFGKKLNSEVSVVPCTIHYTGSEYKVKRNHSTSKSEDVEILEEQEKKIEDTGWNFFVSSVRSRLTVAEVVENVRSKAVMTFDFIVMLLISTTLCALGLVENSNTTMVSSMLISPMMGPVMAGTFGSVIRDKHLQRIGVQNELIGLGIATIVGFCYGSVICLLTDKYGSQDYHDWPTYEMYSRGELRSLWVNAMLAILAGAAVALGILNDNIASFVGVAISTSLMPTAVNTGLLWSLALVYYLKSNGATTYPTLKYTGFYSENSFLELLCLGAISICLTFINIVFIYFAGIFVCKIKEVAPHTSKDSDRRRFWKHDLKVARNYNKTIQDGEFTNAYQSISDQIKQYEKSKDWASHYSTDVSRENCKVRVKRPEFTWSPCFNSVNEGQENGPIKNVIKNDFQQTSPKQKSSHRRLSQIFVRTPPERETSTFKSFVPLEEKTENLEIVTCTKLQPNENNFESSVSNSFQTLNKSSSRKFVVTPCSETDPLLKNMI